MQTITKAIYKTGELKTQKVKRVEKDYSGYVVAGLFAAIGVTVLILNYLGMVANY